MKYLVHLHRWRSKRRYRRSQPERGPISVSWLPIRYSAVMVLCMVFTFSFRKNSAPTQIQLWSLCGLHFGQRTEIFTWIQLNIWYFWEIFEFMYTTLITEIFWPKCKYLSAYWNQWHSVNFIEISLKLKAMLLCRTVNSGIYMDCILLGLSAK